MRTDKIRKYLIPNIPYLFILWAFLKLGTAYRLAAGNDFAHKLIGLGQTIGPAFADFAPGLAPLDWLVGIVGAVGFRLLIYFKSKNAKKFRRDAEYGTARFGTKEDITRHMKCFRKFVLLADEQLPPCRCIVITKPLRVLTMQGIDDRPDVAVVQSKVVHCCVQVRIFLPTEQTVCAMLFRAGARSNVLEIAVFGLKILHM